MQHFVRANRQVDVATDALDRSKALVAHHLDILQLLFIFAERGYSATASGIDVPAEIGGQLSGGGGQSLHHLLIGADARQRVFVLAVEPRQNLGQRFDVVGDADQSAGQKMGDSPRIFPVFFRRNVVNRDQ